MTIEWSLMAVSVRHPRRPTINGHHSTWRAPKRLCARKRCAPELRPRLALHPAFGIRLCMVWRDPCCRLRLAMVEAWSMTTQRMQAQKPHKGSVHHEITGTAI